MLTAARAWLGTLARWVVGAVLIVIGAARLPDPTRSVAAVRSYDLLPSALVPSVGELLPVVEIVIGLCLVLGVLTRGAGVLSGLLWLAAAFGVGSLWVRGADAGTSAYVGDLARDVGLLLLSAYVAWSPRSRLALENVRLGRRRADRRAARRAGPGVP